MQKTCFMLIFGFVLLSVSCIQAQPPTKTFTTGSNYWGPTDYTWTKTPWTADDPRYPRIRQNTEAGVENGEITKQTASEYETSYQKDTKNKEALLRWAYAVYQGGSAMFSYTEERTILQRIDKILAEMPLPYPREFVRLRFLVETRAYPTRKLIPAGTALISTDNQDNKTKFYQADLLSYAPTVSDKKLALKYALELVDSQREKPVYHALLADTYASLWKATHDPALPAKAVAEYKIYLASLSPNDEWRASTERGIKDMEAAQSDPAVPKKAAIPAKP